MKRGVQPPRVAVLVDTATGWGRQVTRGIIAYARRHGPWHLWVEPHGQEEKLGLPPGWAGEGVIARISDHVIARRMAAAGVPIVNISSIELRGIDLPRVCTDQAAAGRLAAKHLLDCGLRSLAYVGSLRLAYVEKHCEAFAVTVEKTGADCAIYRPRRSLIANWLAYQDDLARWLQSLPKPVGILAWNCHDGRRVIDACRFAGLSVPEQVAVLAGDDDELLCEACSPPLSGTAMPAQQIGLRAAALLDRLMGGGRSRKNTLLIKPTGVVSRQSTNTLAIEDPELVQAIRFIRDHAADLIGVDDVLRAVPVSRRRLEIRFHDVLGRSPAAEIRRVHLERAKELLSHTDMPIPKVADSSGFGSPEYLAYVFKQDTGLSPLKYRTWARSR